MIFINYRREDAGDLALPLADKLKNIFGEEAVFLDKEKIELGDRWQKDIESALSRAVVVLALIGRQWLKVCDEYGRRRIDRDDDILAYELSVALQRNIVVIPLYLHGLNPMPAMAFPSRLVGLAEQQGIEFDMARDMPQLLARLEKIPELRELKDRTREELVAATYPVAKWCLDDVRRACRKATEDQLERIKGARIYVPGIYARRFDVETCLASFLDCKCTKTGMLIIGGSGIGKTNTLCHTVEQWRDGAGKSTRDIVLLLTGNSFPESGLVLEEFLAKRLGGAGTLQDFLAEFVSQRKQQEQLIIIADGLDTYSDPAALIRQLDELIAQCEKYAGVKIVLSVGEAVWGVIQSRGFIPSVRDYFTVPVKSGAIERESVEVILRRMNEEELVEAYRKYQDYESRPGLKEYCPSSPFSSLSSEVRDTICYPFWLSIVMKVYHGQPIPPRVATAGVLQKYCHEKIFKHSRRLLFIHRLVDILFEKNQAEISLDDLASPPELLQEVLDRKPTSSYLELLNEQVLIQQDKPLAMNMTKWTLGFAHDRVCEHLLACRFVEKFGMQSEQIAGLSEKAVRSAHLRGALRMLLLGKIEEGGVDQATAWLRVGNRETMKSVALDLLIELEQLAPTNAQTSPVTLAESRVGQLVVSLLRAPDSGLTSALIEFAEKLRDVGFFQRAGFVYERLVKRVGEEIPAAVAARLHQGWGEVRNHFGDKDGALRDYERALHLYCEERDRAGQAAALNAVGQMHFDLADFPRAIESFEQSLAINRELASAHPDSEARKSEAESLRSMADVHKRAGRIADALHCVEKARAISKEINDERGSASAMNLMGDLHRREGRFSEARHYHEQALHVFQQLGDRRGVALSLCYLAIIIGGHGEGNWEAASPKFAEALRISSEIGAKEIMAYTYNCRGESLRAEAESRGLAVASSDHAPEVDSQRKCFLERALSDYTNALSLYESMKEKRNIAMCKNNLAATYLFLGNADAAVGPLEEAIKLQVEVHRVEGGQPESLAYLSAAHLQLGHQEQALDISNTAVSVLQRAKKRFGQEDVQLVYWYRHQILTAMARNQEAAEALHIAFENVMEQAKSIADATKRNASIQRVWLRRLIANTWKELEASRGTVPPQ